MMTRTVRETATILVADDDETMLRVTATFLRRAGYTVLTAQDGAQALQLFNESSQPVHLVISDVTMPRMGGPQLVESLKERSPSIGALLMSATRDIECDAGVWTIEKPFTREALVAKVESLLSTCDFGSVRQEQAAKPHRLAAIVGVKSNALRPSHTTAAGGGRSRRPKPIDASPKK